MPSRKLLRPSVVLLTSLGIVPGVLSAQATPRAWCSSELEAPVVYLMWAKMQAQGHSLKPEIAKCVGQYFAEGLRAKPYPNRVKEEYDGAVAACKR